MHISNKHIRSNSKYNITFLRNYYCITLQLCFFVMCTQCVRHRVFCRNIIAYSLELKPMLLIFCKQSSSSCRQVLTGLYLSSVCWLLWTNFFLLSFLTFSIAKYPDARQPFTYVFTMHILLAVISEMCLRLNIIYVVWQWHERNSSLALASLPVVCLMKRIRQLSHLLRYVQYTE